MKKQTKELIIKNSIVISKFFIILSALYFLYCLAGEGYEAIPDSDTTICYNFKALNETIHDIEKNCGSIFITKKFGEEGWFIFKGNVCDGKKCEHKYIPIEECLG